MVPTATLRRYPSTGPFSQQGMCIYSCCCNTNNLSALPSMPLLSLDLAMLTLTVRRVLKLSRGPRAEPLLHIILRDGIWAVFAMWSESFSITIRPTYCSYFVSVSAMAALIMSVTGHLRIAFLIAGYALSSLVYFNIAQTSFIQLMVPGRNLIHCMHSSP
jgi:hypothetical protein